MINIFYFFLRKKKMSGSMYDPCEMLRQYKARAAQAVTSDPSQMFEGKASKTGGEILMSRKLKKIPDKYSEMSFYSIADKGHYPIASISDVMIEKYKTKTGKEAYMLKAMKDKRKLVRKIKKDMFDELYGSGVVDSDTDVETVGGEVLPFTEAQDLRNNAAAGFSGASSGIIGKLTGGVVEEVSQGIQEAVKFAVELMQKISSEDIRKQAIDRFIEQTGVNREMIPQDILDSTLDDVKMFVRDASHAQNNEQAQKDIERTHRQNMEKKGYIGTSEEVADADPHFWEKVLTGEYSLKNAGVDVFKTDKLALRRRINKAKKELEKLGLKAVEKDKPDIEPKVEAPKSEKKPIGEQYEIMEATGESKPIKNNTDVAMSSSSTRYPAGSSEKLTGSTGATNYTPSFGNGMRRMIRGRGIKVMNT